MTFIASVIAKKGVAIIADSLSTSILPILHHYNFLNYLNAQPVNANGEKIINPDDINSLFSNQPIFTRNYQEKLSRLNRYAAITTAGAAYINDKNISDLIQEFKDDLTDLDDFSTKLTQFSDFLNKEIRLHLTKYEFITESMFIITSYEKSIHKTSIHKIYIFYANKEEALDLSHNFVFIEIQPDWATIVSSGQNKFSEQLLYGFGRDLRFRFEEIANKILLNLPLPATFNKQLYVDALIKDPYFDAIFYDIEMFNLTELSVQQAVDLASLLMKSEVDFQKYTKDIPTVGGLIKLAVINDNGFAFISGDDIKPPKHIIYE